MSIATLEGKPKHNSLIAVLWHSITGTANEIAGFCVGTLTLGTAGVVGVRKLKMMRHEQKRKDKENRELLLGLPKVITDMGQTITTLSESVAELEKYARNTNAGVHGLAAAIQVGGMTVSGLIKDIRYMKQRRDMELEDEGVCWWECDAKGLTVAVSQPLCDLFGLTREQMLLDGTGWLGSIEGQNSSAWSTWVGAVNSKLPYRDIYRIINRRTRNRYLVESSGVRFETEPINGETMCFYGVVKVLEELPVVDTKVGHH